MALLTKSQNSNNFETTLGFIQTLQKQFPVHCPLTQTNWKISSLSIDRRATKKSNKSLVNEKLDVNYASATALCNLIPFWPQCMISWLPIEKDEEDDDVDDNEDRKDDPAIPAEDDDCRSDHNAWLPDCQSRQTNYSLSATMQCLPSSLSG